MRQTDTASGFFRAIFLAAIVFALAFAGPDSGVSPASAETPNIQTPTIQTPGDKILAKSQSPDPASPNTKKPGKIVERAAAILDALGALAEKRGKKLPGLADYYDTKESLSRIDDSAPEAPRAKKLFAAMEKNERDYLKKVSGGDISANIAARADDIDSRQKFAADTAKRMLRRGLSMTIATSGEKDTVLTYKYFRMDRTTVLNFAESGRIFNKARDLGFRTVVFTDGRVNWTYDVVANTFQ